MPGMRKLPENISYYCVPRSVVTCGCYIPSFMHVLGGRIKPLSQSYLQSTGVLKHELLHQWEELLATEWEIASMLDKYDYLHYVKVRGKRGTKVTCQRTAEVQISKLPFCRSQVFCWTRLSGANSPYPFKSVQTGQMITTQPVPLSPIQLTFLS